MIGSGIIGRAFAICFSRVGYEVALWDPVEGVAGAAPPTIEGTVLDLEEHDLLNGHSAAAVMSRVGTAEASKPRSRARSTSRRTRPRRSR
jgi:L-gulonate 3-dehydrogenase